MTHRLFYFIFIYLFSNQVYSQVGGRRSFEFLNLSANTRTAALGGLNASLAHQDVNMWLNNPALLDSAMGGNASINFTSFFTGIPHSLVTYAFNSNKLGTVGLGLQYIGYGKMEQTDAAGNVIGEFTSNEFAFNVGKSFKSENFRFGLNFKIAGSQIIGYSALGLALDLGGSFQHPQKDLTVGLVLKNIGFTFKNYFPGSQLKLPFDAQLGVSFKPEYMPFRFSLTAHHLYRWEIAYNDPSFNSFDPLTGISISQKISFVDQLFRHLVFGGELIIHKNFQIRLGYNHLRNRELSLEQAARFAGVSGGLAFRIKGFEVAYSRATFYSAAGRSFISLSKNLQEIFKKKQG